MNMELMDRLAIDTTYADHSVGRLLYALALAERARTVLEIGYCLGYSASWLCGGIAESTRPVAPHLIDLGFRRPKPDVPVMVSVDIERRSNGDVIQQQGFAFHRLLAGNSRDPAIVAAVVKALGRPIDLLFIDGDHESAYGDWLAYREYLDPEALIACHDSWYEPVRQALARTGLKFVDLGGHARLAVAWMTTA